ncbi:MAG: hypothetical protein ACREV5_00625 [Steroidobacter sp.]
MIRVCLVTFVFVAAIAAAPLTRVQAQVLPASMRTCASEKDDARRLSCYDREIAQLENASDAVEPAPAPTPAASTAPEDKFGYRGQLARDELDRQAAKDAVERLDATVTEISTRPRGELVLTLDNGQVWAQKSVDTRARLKVGDKVAIKKASFGSFMLVTSAGRSTRVTRVQ